MNRTFFQSGTKGLRAAGIKTNQKNLHIRFILTEILHQGANRYPGGFLERIAVNSGTDRREGDTGAAGLPGQLHTVPVASPQELGFFPVSAAPDGADSVDDVERRQAVSARYLGFTGFASAQAAAFIHELGSCGTVDGTVHSPAAQERAVGGVHNGVHPTLGNIAFNYLNFHHLGSLGKCIPVIDLSADFPDPVAFDRSSGFLRPRSAVILAVPAR